MSLNNVLQHLQADFAKCNVNIVAFERIILPIQGFINIIIKQANLLLSLKNTNFTLTLIENT